MLGIDLLIQTFKILIVLTVAFVKCRNSLANEIIIFNEINWGQTLTVSASLAPRSTGVNMKENAHLK